MWLQASDINEGGSMTQLPHSPGEKYIVKGGWRGGGGGDS